MSARSVSAAAAAGQNHFISPEQAASVQALLTTAEQQLHAGARRIDCALSTPYPRAQARADYHALLATLQQLEALTLPVANIAFDEEALTNHAQATAAAASAASAAIAANASPATPAAAAAASAADATRFVGDLTRMSATLKADAATLSQYVAHVKAHTRASSTQLREGKPAMMQGAVAAAQAAMHHRMQQFEGQTHSIQEHALILQQAQQAMQQAQNNAQMRMQQQQQQRR